MKTQVEIETRTAERLATHQKWVAEFNKLLLECASPELGVGCDPDKLAYCARQSNEALAGYFELKWMLGG